MAAPTTTPSLWHRVLNDPQLRDLPFKIETEEPDRIILSPHKARHSLHQGRLVELLSEHVPGGRSAVEFAVETPRGVKVPDVAWISDAVIAELRLDDEASRTMPEIVIEVLSQSNPQREMQERIRLYLDGGAHEVWLCDADGRLAFYGVSGEIDGSALAPSFPRSLD
jgi:Uma2 family endonuclease